VGRTLLSAAFDLDPAFALGPELYAETETAADLSLVATRQGRIHRTGGPHWDGSWPGPTAMDALSTFRDFAAMSSGVESPEEISWTGGLGGAL